MDYQLPAVEIVVMSTERVPASVRWYLRSRRLVTLCVDMVNALHSGFWLGALSDDTFRSFDSYPFHPLQPAGKLADQMLRLEPWEEQMLAGHFSTAESLLLVGAGGGRELICFQRNGLQVVPFEYDAELAAETNGWLEQLGRAERLRVCPRYEIPVVEKKFDGVWVGRRFFSSIRGRDQRLAFLRRLRASCTDDARLLLAFYVRGGNGIDWRINQWLGNIVRALGGRNRQAIELGDHLDTETPLYHHHFLEQELRNELSCAGWDVVFYAEDWFGYAVATPLAVAESHSPVATQLQQA